MNSKKLLKELSVLDHTTFIYDGELYDTTMKDWHKHSIGYLPELIYDVAVNAGMNEKEIDDFEDFIQTQLYDHTVRRYRNADTETIMKNYAAAVKWELLDYTDLI